MKTFVIAALHGDELFGLKIVGRIQRANVDNILTKVGHPEAIAMRRRFIDQDLNRSFLSETPSIETSIAQVIKKEMSTYDAELIIDIHTSVSNTGNVAIVAKHTPIIEYVAQALGMEAIVIMPTALAETSLIGCFPEKSLSLEFGRYARSDKLADEIANRIQMLRAGEVPRGRRIPIFEVYTTIDKHFAGLATVKNLELNAELGGYPFLAGATTYATIGGFLARRILTSEASA
jgi:succinylglutamate desuccinylase